MVSIALPPPVLFLVQQVQQENIVLRDESSKLKAALEDLKIKYKKNVNENVDLAKAVEEANKIVKDVNATNDNLQIKINVMEKDATKYLLDYKL